MNIKVNSFDDQIEVYIKNALTLSKSLKLQGISFTLLTNDKVHINKILNNINEFLVVEEITFSTVVPTGSRFYSAHFKLDVFKYFSTLESKEYVGICDLDMICINQLPQSLENCINDKIPCFYDITDQVINAYGANTIINDIELLTGVRSEGRWAGGELILGDSSFFKKLSNTIDDIYINYINNIKTLHHVGDEAFTSAALEILRKSGTYIADIGQLNIVGRHWNCYVEHDKRAFSYYSNCFLLHLPADKRFLADISSYNLNTSNDYLIQYNRYRNSLYKIIKIKILKILKNR